MTILDGQRRRSQPHPELRLVSPRRDIDVAAAEAAVRSLLTALGADLGAEQLVLEAEHLCMSLRGVQAGESGP